MAEKEPHQMNEGLDNMKTILIKRYGEEGSRRFCELLKSTGSLIAGGSVLACILNENINTINDIDIYVPIKKSQEFLNELIYKEDRLTKNINNYVCDEYSSSLYCTSFLKRNGIKKVMSLIDGSARDKYTSLAGTTSQQNNIDIMLVRNKRTPLQVVTNFDLTFCECWFDGENIWATFPEHIRSKNGKVQSDYVEMVIIKNKFTEKRMAKYIERGFKISLEPLSNVDLHYNREQGIILFDKKNICPEEEYKYNHPIKNIVKNEWTVRLLLKWFSGNRTNVETIKYIGKNEDGYRTDEEEQERLADDAYRLIQDKNDLLLFPDVNKNRSYLEELKPDPYNGYDSEDYIKENKIDLQLLIHDTTNNVDEYLKKADKLYKLITTPLEYIPRMSVEESRISYGDKKKQSLGYLLQKYNSENIRQLLNILRSACYGPKQAPKDRPIPKGATNSILWNEIKDGDLMANFYTNTRNGVNKTEFNYGRYYKAENARQLKKHPLTRQPITLKKEYKAKLVEPIPESSVTNTKGGYTRKNRKKGNKHTRSRK